jgi:hypothetical protein
MGWSRRLTPARPQSYTNHPDPFASLNLLFIPIPAFFPSPQSSRNNPLALKSLSRMENKPYRKQKAHFSHQMHPLKHMSPELAESRSHPNSSLDSGMSIVEIGQIRLDISNTFASGGAYEYRLMHYWLNCF